MKAVKILVESELDAMLVHILIERAFPNYKHIVQATHARGKVGALKQLVLEIGNSESHEATTIALIDADAISVAQARAEIGVRVQLGEKREEVMGRTFFAVPEFESWLFADATAVSRHARRQSPLLDRIRFPDELPDPRNLAEQVFGPGQRKNWSRLIVMEMDLDVAVAHSPSLRDFLKGVGTILGDDRFSNIFYAYNMLGARLLSSLVGETNPKNSVMFKTLEGDTFTAERLEREIAEGTEVAIEYASSILRVARDQLARQARKKKADL